MYKNQKKYRKNSVKEKIVPFRFDGEKHQRGVDFYPSEKELYEFTKTINFSEFVKNALREAMKNK